MSAATPPPEAAAAPGMDDEGGRAPSGSGDEGGRARGDGTGWAMSAAVLAVETATAAVWATKAAGLTATERGGR